MLSYARRVVVASALLVWFRLLPGVLSSRIGAAFQQAEHAAEGFIHQKLHHGPAYGLHAADVAGQQPATAVEVVPFPQAGDARLLPSFFNSLCMILVTEIGDETFIIAALMAMRHPRLPVFGGAMSALALMTIISTGMGFLAPFLITRKATSRVATGLYTFFGLRLFYLAYKADPNGTAEDEIEEVEQKLSSGGAKKHGRLGRVVARFCTPIFLEAFILTFLAEWGDRSQIATITLASHMNPLCVTVGAIVGHCICTSTAVTGGELLAKRISQRTVAVMGGLVFMLFAVYNGLITPA